jgi:hypothetical protein
MKRKLIFFEKYEFMLTFKPLKTKALITHGNIMQKRSFLSTGEFPSNCRLTGLVSIQTSKTRLMMLFSMMDNSCNYFSPIWRNIFTFKVK